jgi:hypothetical protein
MIKRELLLERDYSLFDNWDAMQWPYSTLKEPVADSVVFRKSSAEGITLRVYGTIGTSDLTGGKTIEDMEVKLGDIDITDRLSDKFLQNLVHEAVEENT